MLYVPAGVAVVAKRAADAHSTRIHQRMIRAHEARGDFAGVAEWVERAAKEREQRHRRAMDWLGAPWKITRAVVLACLGVLVAALAIGVVLAVASKDVGRVLEPIAALLELVEWIAWTVTVTWAPLVLAAPWVLLLWLLSVGRASGTVPQWVQTAAADDDELVIDERAITGARHHRVRQDRCAVAVPHPGPAGRARHARSDPADRRHHRRVQGCAAGQDAAR